MTAARSTSFTAAVRMIHRIHRNTANGGPHTPPSLRASFTQFAKVMLAMTYLADSRAAINMYLSRLA